ncbi:MAG: hypothetical protein GY828_08315 [Candidatus Gracilibacteria bacterium]|nr:hypothetical protein [Candidatus Gracilibacteria bacterium]
MIIKEPFFDFKGLLSESYHIKKKLAQIFGYEVNKNNEGIFRGIDGLSVENLTILNNSLNENIEITEDEKKLLMYQVNSGELKHKDFSLMDNYNFLHLITEVYSKLGIEFNNNHIENILMDYEIKLAGKINNGNIQEVSNFVNIFSKEYPGYIKHSLKLMIEGVHESEDLSNKKIKEIVTELNSLLESVK